MKENLEISDADIKARYDGEPQEYNEPEQVRIAYVDLSRQRMADAIQIDAEKLREYYESNRAIYEVADQRKFRQLFIATGKDASPEQAAAAMTEIQALRDLIAAGSSFEDAVASRKTETSPTVEIADQDFMTKGIMEPEIDNVLFALSEGEISNPIVTESGLHIIKLEGIKGGTSNTFENVRDQVEQDYRSSLVESDFINAVDQLTNLAFEHPDTLDLIADELGLPVRESPFFDRQWQPEELLRNPKIVNASFSDDVLAQGNNSEPIEVEENRLVVLRVLEHKPARKRPLAEVRDRVITRLKFERARDATRARGERIIGELKNNMAMDAMASREGFEWKMAAGVMRDDATIDGAILQTAFRLGRPPAGGRIYGGSSLNSGDYAVIVVAAVQDAAPDAMSAEELKSLRAQLEEFFTSDAVAQLIEDLKSRADIHVYRENL
jgi:peptidyl-prolyl cis-trans isomerase D